MDGPPPTAIGPCNERHPSLDAFLASLHVLNSHQSHRVYACNPAAVCLTEGRQYHKATIFILRVRLYMGSALAYRGRASNSGSGTISTHSASPGGSSKNP